MPEEPTPPPPPPPAPRPVIPIAPPVGEIFEAEIDDTPVMPIAEPGVITPAPFAQVYSPPPAAAADGLPASMTTSPPPLPQGYYPPAYPQQAPAQPPAWPDPVDYRSRGADGYQRPGIITALGVTAIIVACLSLVTSLFSGCTALVVGANAKRAAAMSRMTVKSTLPKVTTPGTSIDPAGPDGLPANERAVVTRALRDRMRHPLSTERERQLDGFLAQHGRLILDDSARPLTRQGVAGLLGQVGQEFATAGKVGPDFFIFKSGKLPGRLLLKDDAAIFKPDDYSPTLSSSTPPPQADPAAVDVLVANGLDDEQAQAVLARVRELSNQRISGPQLSTLNSLLQSPTCANWLTPSSTIPGVTAQVKSAAVLSDGSITITFTMGKLAMDPQGNLVGPVPPAPTATATTSPTIPPLTIGAIGVDKGSCTLAVADAAVSGLLAIYLFVIAILSLRQAGTPRLLFMIYALAKLACGAAGIVGFAWMMHSLSAASGPTGFAFKGMASAALTLASIGIAYPIAVLLTLTLSKTARDYYKGST